VRGIATSRVAHCREHVLNSKIVKTTLLCCDTVKQISLDIVRADQMAKEVTMSAVAAVPTKASHRAPRGSDLPTCPVCADSMIAAEASAFLTDDVVSYLWTCDTCGYGFVTQHAFARITCT
jgi:hypothetical protein